MLQKRPKKPWWRNPRVWLAILLLELSAILAVFLLGRARIRGSPPNPPAAVVAAAGGMASADTTFAPPEAGMPGMLPVGGGTLRASESQSHPFSIDVSAPCTVLLLYPHGELDLEVKSPSGRIWSSREHQESGQSGRMEGIFGLMPGWTDGIWIEQADPGQWSAKVTARTIPDSVREISYMVTMIQDTGGRGPILRSLIDDRTHHRGEAVDLRASLLEAGKPVEGARVVANVGTFGGKNKRLVLNDDGRPPDAVPRDGIYSARMPALRDPGWYDIAFSASRSGVVGRPDFQRVTVDEVIVSRSRSRLNGRFRDFGRDTNGDGLNDELVIEVGVTVTDRTSLGLRGMLFDRKGKLHDGGRMPDAVEPGERTLELTYPTEFLYGAGESGPFLLDTLRLFEEEEGWIAPLEERTHVYSTREYSRRDFQYEKILLNGEVEARGVDTNANGLFDILVIEVGVDIDFPGDYLWHALLVGGDDPAQGFAQGNERGRLQRGSNRLRFEFPGACIARMTDEGGYTLESLYVGLLSLGDPPKSAPRHAFTGPRIPIRGAPPPGRFEKTGPKVFRSALGGNYSCGVAPRGNP